MRSAPLVAHVIHRLAIGGLENGLVNLVNGIPGDRFRHAIICLTDYTEFRHRIERRDVQVHALHKRPGQDFGMYHRFWRLLKDIRPAIVHTRNLAALELQWVAAAAGVRARVHGEHGWDTIDLLGTDPRYLLLRRLSRAVVRRYIALSRDIEAWLRDVVRVRSELVTQIYNGVDTRIFSPNAFSMRIARPSATFASNDIVFGTVGRLEPVKNPLLLVEAFAALADSAPALRPRLKLAIVGDGSLRSDVATRLEQAGLAEHAWLPGALDDISAVLQSFDVFVLPSLNEGISNTVLEAMASGLPVIATRVGGNPELVRARETGMLTRPGDAADLAAAMRRYAENGELRVAHGRAGRARAEANFSLGAMTSAYVRTYDELLAGQ